jgi:hypothetical protein
MSNLCLPLGTDIEGKPLGWRRCCDRTATPSSSSSSPTDGQEEEGEAITDDGWDEEGDAGSDAALVLP